MRSIIVSTWWSLSAYIRTGNNQVLLAVNTCNQSIHHRQALAGRTGQLSAIYRLFFISVLNPSHLHCVLMVRCLCRRVCALPCICSWSCSNHPHSLIMHSVTSIHLVRSVKQSLLSQRLDTFITFQSLHINTYRIHDIISRRFMFTMFSQTEEYT